MKPIVRAIPRISRSKPSIAPVGERRSVETNQTPSAWKAGTL
jgi:hypothetical protein